MIKIQNLKVKYQKNLILNDINLDFNGGILNILGQNGSGKSTLLKTILGLLKFDGKILISNKNLYDYNVKELANLLAYIPQYNHTPFNYNVLEMVLMGRIAKSGIFSPYSKKDKQIALECLDSVGIKNLAKREFCALSGGQKQLVLIARALSSQAEIFVMDEPVNGLDFANQVRLLEMIKNLAEERNFIITTHHPKQAKFLGGDMILLKNGKIFKKLKSQELKNDDISRLYELDYAKYEKIL